MQCTNLDLQQMKTNLFFANGKSFLENITTIWWPVSTPNKSLIYIPRSKTYLCLRLPHSCSRLSNLPTVMAEQRPLLPIYLCVNGWSGWLLAEWWGVCPALGALFMPTGVLGAWARRGGGCWLVVQFIPSVDCCVEQNSWWNGSCSRMKDEPSRNFLKIIIRVTCRRPQTAYERWIV